MTALLGWVPVYVAAVLLGVAVFLSWVARRAVREQLRAEERLRVLAGYRVVVTTGTGTPDAGGNVIDLTFGALQVLAAGEADLPPLALVRGNVAAWCLGPAPRQPRAPGHWGRDVAVPDRTARNNRGPGPPECPTCSSSTRNRRLDFWSHEHRAHTRCPDPWHPQWAKILDEITRPL